MVDVAEEPGVVAPVTFTCATDHVYVAPLTPFVVKLIGIVAPEQTGAPEVTAAEGTGFTVAVLIMAVPVHPDAVGVIMYVAVPFVFANALSV